MTNDFITTSISELLQEKITTKSKGIFDNELGLTKRNIENELANLAHGGGIKVIDDISQMPPVINGFRTLEYKGYYVVEPIVLDEFPIIIPAGYNGFIRSSNPPVNSNFLATNMAGKSLFNTLHISGIILSISEPTTGFIRLKLSAPHGLFNGQHINISGTGIDEYDDINSRLLISNAETVSDELDVELPFFSDATGFFNTGFNGLGLDFMSVKCDTTAPNLFDVDASEEIDTLFSYDSFLAVGFLSLGTIRNAKSSVGSRGQLFPLNEGFTFEDCTSTTLNESLIQSVFYAGGTPAMLKFIGSKIKDILISNSKLNLSDPLQYPIRLDGSLVNAKISIKDTPDNEVSTDYFDTTSGGLDQTTPIVIANSNGARPNSMASAQVGFTNIAAAIEVTIISQDVPVIIGGAQYLSDGLERATATTAGQITNLTKATKKYPITFSALIEKVGGGATDIGLLLVKNGSLTLLDTFEIPHSVNSGIIQISATRDFTLAELDTCDLAVVNFDGTANIAVSQANISYSLGV